MSPETLHIDPITATSSCGIMHLRHYWSRVLAIRNRGLSSKDFNQYHALDSAMFSALRLSIEPVTQYLFAHNPTFEEFEAWIASVTGGFHSEWISLFNRAITAPDDIPPYQAPEEDLLTDADWDFWNAHGYLIIRNAISPEDCRNTRNLMYTHLGIDPDDPSTWYRPHSDKQGIMIQLFHHEILEKNRLSSRIRNVYAQIWQRNDLLPSADRVSFNPPQTATYQFQGPDLHWDVSLQQPIPFGTQGLLYLADTATNQGAFTLVPGFQHRVGSWIASLPEGRDPRAEDLHALGSVPIAANAGDFILWHQALPHGSSPNTSTLPRLVQYINYQPVHVELHPGWI